MTAVCIHCFLFQSGIHCRKAKLFLTKCCHTHAYDTHRQRKTMEAWKTLSLSLGKLITNFLLKGNLPLLNNIFSAMRSRHGVVWRAPKMMMMMLGWKVKCASFFLPSHTQPAVQHHGESWRAQLYDYYNNNFNKNASNEQRQQQQHRHKSEHTESEIKRKRDIFIYYILLPLQWVTKMRIMKIKPALVDEKK